MKCIHQLHTRNIAHRNIKPCNLIYSLKDHCWKLNHFEYAIKYDENVCFYDIIGDDEYIDRKLS